MKTLFLITARGGSKGIPGKNIKELAGIPLIHYSILFARLFAEDIDICLSTDSEDILESAKIINYKAPFIRPKNLALDDSGSYNVIVHAIKFYKIMGIEYDNIVLLQPTSPIRLKTHLTEALSLYSNDIDMVVSVTKTHLYHYYYEKDGLLFPFGQIHQRRQDSEILYKHNGSIYIINTSSLLNYSDFSKFKCVKKFVMDVDYSWDIDTIEEWNRIDHLLRSKSVKFDI